MNCTRSTTNWSLNQDTYTPCAG